MPNHVSSPSIALQPPPCDPVSCLETASRRPRLGKRTISACAQVAFIFITSSGCEAADANSDTGEGSTSSTPLPPSDADPRLACTLYIECIAAVAPQDVGDAIADFGPNGSCWDLSTEVCLDACLDARHQLQALHPDEPTCLACTAHDHCLGLSADARCDLPSGTCVDCAADCNHQACDEAAESCAPCTGSQDCPQGACFAGVCGHAPLFPIAQGNTWTYVYDEIGRCGFQLDAPMNLPGVAAAYPASPFPSNEMCSPGLLFHAVGDHVTSHDQGGGLLATTLAEPVADGATWDLIPGTPSEEPVVAQWREQTEPVTVPAGTFDDCWTSVTDIRYGGPRTFCRGVGLVRWELFGSTHELLEYQVGQP